VEGAGEDSLFVVKGGEANVVADPPVALEGVVKDDSVSIEDGVATCMRQVCGADVYHLEGVAVQVLSHFVKIKTKDFKAQPEIKCWRRGCEHAVAEPGVQPTQDWTRHDVVFNSLDHSEVNIYFGVWNELHGSLQWKIG